MAAKTLAIATAVFSAFMTSHTARADTPNFPDLSAYTPVSGQDYTIAVPNLGRELQATVYFLTATAPAGGNAHFVTCDFVSAAAQCTGNNSPPIPPDGPDGDYWIATDTGLRQANGSIASGNKIHGRPIRKLPALHSITVDGVICGVVDAGTTACKDPQGRGFMVWPQGHEWRPHV